MVLQKKSLSEYIDTSSERLFEGLKALINESDYQTNLDQPYMFVDSTNYKKLTLEDAKLNPNVHLTYYPKMSVIYFDAYNGEEINATFLNLLAYLIKSGF